MAKILVVEDIVSDRRLLCSVVERLGHITVKAADGETAGQALRANPDTALVITDLSMPAIDGFALIEHIQSGVRPIPLIVVTGTIPGPKLVSTLMSQGTLRFLPKPIDRQALEGEINTLLKSPTHCGGNHV